MRNEDKNMALLEAKNVKKIYTTRFGGTQVQAIDRKEEEAMADRMYYLVFRDEETVRVLDGGLLFIGVFFGLLFSVCVVLIMYYKQISEGFEDQDSFHIMKKVGMSDEDVRSTIRRQILLVFGLPVAAAILHTACSINMTVHLLYTLNLFDTAQIYRIGVGVTAVFLVFYGVSYLITARTYYKIVR